MKFKVHGSAEVVHVVDSRGDVDVARHQVVGACGGTVGGGQGVGGARGDLDVVLPRHQHGHVVGSQLTGVVQSHARAVMEVGMQLGVVPVRLNHESLVTSLSHQHTSSRVETLPGDSQGPRPQ
eukprot:GHVL01031368.1.p2 GENE.GHVL01031368.1~~GHVL01031368.1.p2  ORF type:complete len:123 (-),score=25.08 GHVL01031368.1:803-1171(-)